ncbi:MAG: long-chain fatty acid--CoA ligase, partial [Alphaproteobacteria bacterium]
TAFICGDDSLSYAELGDQSRRLAAFLQQEWGLKKGDRVAIALPNVLQFPVTLVCNILAGFVQVNVNPQYTPLEMQHQLNDSGAEILVTGGVALETFRQIAADTGVKKVIEVSLDGSAAGPAIEGVAKTMFFEAIAKYSAHDFAAPDINADDLLFLQYTGGTTGLSKGAMLSHGNLAANIVQTNAWLYASAPATDTRVITALPLYHIFALTVNSLVHMVVGAENVLVTNPGDMDGFVAIMAKHPPTFITGVNTLYNGLVNNAHISDVDFSGLRHAVGGGAPVQKVVSDKWEAITGKMIMEGYGLSETSPVVTMTPGSLREFKSAIGLPAPDTDISIRDDNGAEVPQGESGELCVKGPQVMRGYWGQEDNTSDVMTPDGYFKTGDVGVMDPDGFFHIVDRKKDMVLVSGFNVFPNEIEAVVAGMGAILECACIGVPDDRTGEAVKVFAVQQPGAVVSEDDVRDYCKGKLTGYKVPRHVVFIDALPKSTVGKILRRELRDY